MTEIAKFASSNSNAKEMKEFFKNNKSTVYKLIPPVIAMIWFFTIAYRKTYVDITSVILIGYTFLWCLYWGAKYLGKDN